MATPAAVLSILVKTNGAAASAAQLRALDSAARSTNGNLSNVEKTSRRAGASMNTLGRESHKSGRAMREIGKGAAYALGAGGFGGGMYALFDITRKSIAEFRESQQVARQTGAVLKSTGQAAHVSAKGVDNLANSLKRKTAIDDETIASGENMLLTFTKIRNEAGKGNDIFNQATKAVTDMAVAYNGGAIPSADQMRQKAILLGKALQDPIKGVTTLHRVGVDFTKAQMDQIKALETSGHHLEAQKKILAELKTETGGSAAAQATSAKRLSVTLGDLAEKIGGFLAPVIEKATRKISVFIDQMLAGTGAGGRFVQTMKNIWSAMQPLVSVLKSVVSFLARHPQLLAAAAGAWAAYKVAALIAIGATKLGLLGVFGPSMVAKLTGRAAAAGAASGEAYGAGFSAKVTGVVFSAITGWAIGSWLRKHWKAARDAGDFIGNTFGKFFINTGEDALSKFADKLIDWANGLNSTINTVISQANAALKSVLPKTGRGQGGPQGSGHTNFTGGSVKDGDRAVVAAAAQRFGVSPALLWGIFGKETSYGANVNTSSAGAKGAFQFIKGTAKSYNYPYTNNETGKVFQQQAIAAAHYIADLLKKYKGNVASALLAYSGGGYSNVPGATAGRTGGILGSGKKKAGGSDVPADLAWARRMVGHFKESTGSNTGPELNQLQKKFGTYAAAWCAEFATQALVKAGFPKDILTARVSDLNKWAKAGAKGLSFTTSPSPGDLMTFGNKHVAIVEKVNTSKGTVSTIAGNTGKGQVSRSTYALSAGKYISTNAAGYTPFKAPKPNNVFKVPVKTQAQLYEFVQGRLDHFDLMVQAGLMTAAKAVLAKRNALQAMLPNLTGDTRLQALIALKGLGGGKTPAQKTWTPQAKQRLAMAIIQANPGNVGNLPAGVLKAAGPMATMQNPWLQAFQTNLSNQVGAGVLTQAQADAALADVLKKSLPFLSGQDAADVRTKLFQIATNTKDTARAALDSANSLRASGISDASFLGGLTGPAADAVRGVLSQNGIDILPGGGSISEIGNSSAASILAQADIGTLMGEVRAGQVSFEDVWPQIVSDLGVIASGAEASSEASNAATDAVKALTDEVKKNNEFAQSVTATQLGTTMRALADFINGQIYGNYNNRSSSASSGQVARY